MAYGLSAWIVSVYELIIMRKGYEKVDIVEAYNSAWSVSTFGDQEEIASSPLGMLSARISYK